MAEYRRDAFNVGLDRPPDDHCAGVWLMGYRVVNGDGLRTRYAGTPVVIVHSVPGGPLALELVFQAEPAPAGVEVGFTRVWFEDAREFRWVASDQTYFPANRDDFEFALIEIVDSDQIKRMLAEGLYSDSPPGQRLGGTTDEAALRHFRVGFDDYGSFDVICLGLQTESFRARS